MIAGWIVLAVSVTVLTIMLATAWFRHHQRLDLGTVSHQWVAEQRFGQGSDRQR